MISQARPAPSTVIYIRVIKSVIKSVISRAKTHGNRGLLILSLIYISGKYQRSTNILFKICSKKKTFQY